jgi:hypothetical protein
LTDSPKSSFIGLAVSVRPFLHFIGKEDFKNLFRKTDKVFAASCFLWG